MLFERGRYEEAKAQLRRGVALLNESHKPGACLFRAQLAAVLSVQGEFEEAGSLLEMAEREIRGLGSKAILGQVLIQVAHFNHLQGREAAADAALAEGAAICETLKMADDSYLALELQAARKKMGKAD